MYIAILGRQPKLSIAELESRFGADKTRWFSSQAATVDSAEFAIDQLGGTLKAGKVTMNIPRGNWQKISQEVINAYSHDWSAHEGKITLGISCYGFDTHPRDVQKIGIIIKKNLKKSGVSLRLIPNTEPHLNTATSHHNKLGLSGNKVELLIVKSESGAVIVAESTGAQNITALARRDQGRPKRDAFVGMLPPKLALMMINLASIGIDKRVARGGAAPASREISDFREDGADRARGPHEDASSWGAGTGPAASDLRSEVYDGSGNTKLRLLDPFCGTGVVLQEAALLGYNVYGTDLSDKMVDYSKMNLEWLEWTKKLSLSARLEQGDAMKHTWQQPIDLVVSETYLGQPFSAPPSPAKLEEVKRNVDYITTNFLKNIHPQLPSGTLLCLAVPAWRDSSGKVTHLPFIRSLSELGYTQAAFKHVDTHDLLYYREDQVVARELLVLVRA